MGRMSRVAQSRVALALLGAILVGGVCAAVAGDPAILGGFGRLLNPFAGAVNSDSKVATTATATPEPTQTPQQVPTPTAPPRIHAPVLDGTVVSVAAGTNSFVLSHNGARLTIEVNATTTYGGTARKLSDLQPGWQVEATCTAKGSGTYLATHVHADPPGVDL